MRAPTGRLPRTPARLPALPGPASLTEVAADDCDGDLVHEHRPEAHVLLRAALPEGAQDLHLRVVLADAPVRQEPELGAHGGQGGGARRGARAPSTPRAARSGWRAGGRPASGASARRGSAPAGAPGASAALTQRICPATQRRRRPPPANQRAAAGPGRPRGQLQRRPRRAAPGEGRRGPGPAAAGGGAAGGALGLGKSSGRRRGVVWPREGIPGPARDPPGGRGAAGLGGAAGAVGAGAASRGAERMSRLPD